MLYKNVIAKTKSIKICITSKVKISFYCKNPVPEMLLGGIHFSSNKVGNKWAATVIVKGIF